MSETLTAKLVKINDNNIEIVTYFKTVINYYKNNLPIFPMLKFTFFKRLCNGKYEVPLFSFGT